MGRRSTVQAVSGISFAIQKGETLGLVGESGCGKTTLARALVSLQPVTSGWVDYNGQRLTGGRRQQGRGARTGIQMIFQDAAASLNPGRSVGKTIAEPLRAGGETDRRTRYRLAAEVMRDVGLEPATMFGRRPFEFSGGQCQRISIARALITSPRMLICDEPVSSLDVSVQAQILNLLRRIKSRYGLTMLFISHDLSVVKNVSDHVGVMYMGVLCEIAPAEQFYRSPLHPYAAALLAAVPDPGPDRSMDSAHRTTFDNAGPPPGPTGCRYQPRCSHARLRCTVQKPALRQITAHRQVACHFPLHSSSAAGKQRGSNLNY